MEVLNLKLTLAIRRRQRTCSLAYESDQGARVVLTIGASLIFISLDEHVGRKNLCLDLGEGITIDRSSLEDLNTAHWDGDAVHWCPDRKLSSSGKIRSKIIIDSEKIRQTWALDDDIVYGARCELCRERPTEVDTGLEQILLSKMECAREFRRRHSDSEILVAAKFGQQLDELLEYGELSGTEGSIPRCWCCGQIDGEWGTAVMNIEAALRNFAGCIRDQVETGGAYRFVLKTVSSEDVLLIRVLESDIFMFCGDFVLRRSEFGSKRIKLSLYHRVLFQSTGRSSPLTRTWISESTVWMRTLPQNALDHLLNELNSSRENFVLPLENYEYDDEGFNLGYLAADSS